MDDLRSDNGLRKRYLTVKKTIRLLSSDTRYKSLNTHEFTSLSSIYGKKVFEAHAEQPTPSAYRVFWCYGPAKGQITIIAITPHP